MKKLMFVIWITLISGNIFATEIYLSTTTADRSKEFVLDKTVNDKLYPKTQGDSIVFNEVFFGMKHCYVGDVNDVLGLYKKFYDNDEDMSFLLVKNGQRNAMIALYDNWQYFNEGNTDVPDFKNAFDFIKHVVVLEPCN